MSLLNTLSFIVNHPIGRRNKLKYLLRFLYFQISQRLVPRTIEHQLTDKCKLLVSRGMTGATGNIYTGLHEFEDMGFVLHYLRPEDVFIDIGANVGSYTVLASAHVGSRTISIEPLPATFESLQKNVILNNIQDKVRLINKAAGSSTGTLNFTSSLDTMNHVAIDGEGQNIVEVKVEKLDNMLQGDEQPEMIKIDVEGFETEALKGADQTLGNDALNVILIELNGSGIRYGYYDEDISKKLMKYRFLPYSYNPLTRVLESQSDYGKGNTIFIRDVEQAKRRVHNAEKIKIDKFEI